MLSEDIVKYPFLARSREQLAKTPITAIDLPHDEILNQARYRIDRAIKIMNLEKIAPYRRYEARVRDFKGNSDIVEFYSFWISIMGAASDGFVTKGLAKAEVERVRDILTHERGETIAGLLKEVTNIILNPVDEYRDLFGLTIRATYTCPVENYIMVITKYNLNSNIGLKLGRMILDNGLVYLGRNQLFDAFLTLAQEQMLSGMRAIRNLPAPEPVKKLITEIQDSPYIPAPRGPTGGYEYIERLLKAPPIKDGRHRFIWLILSPYFGVVKNMDEQSATDAIIKYIGDERYRTFAKYHVRRAIRYRLMPLSSVKIKESHKDILENMPHGVII